MFEAFCREKLAPLTLRLALGAIGAYHGFLKIMAAGGTNWYPGMPTGWQAAVAWGEFAAALAVLVGFRCRLAAAVLLGLTIGTACWVQGWSLLKLPVRSLEPTVMLMLVALALLCLGAGGLSIDGKGAATLALGRAAAKRK